ncbi:MAG: amidohydrolase [Burkholderiales bacterium]
MPHTVVYAARRILTMDPARPEATHVAVRDGRVLGVGTPETLRGWGAFDLDERFAGKVLLPGFVEGHSHVGEGTYWRYVYCGYFDRVDPDGRTWAGLRSIEAVVERLREAHAALPDPTTPLFGWALDPLFFGARRMSRQDLDAVSTTRPIGILHASGHITNANTAALAAAGYMRTDHDHPGIPLDGERLPQGELRGPDTMMPVLLKLGVDRAALSGDEIGMRAFARLAVRTGTTTATDLAPPIPDDAVDALLRVTGEDAFPLRFVPAMHVRGYAPKDAVERALALKARSTDRLRLGRVKAHADGSIQGFTARMRWPGYHNGAPQGLWYIEPETLRGLYGLALRHGVQVHTHTNGDAAIELAIETMRDALREHAAPDHRFALQHCQLADRAQLRRMATLGMCANFFANHHWYWGDAHYAQTVGPDRAERMNPCRSAEELGVAWTIHSDAPVTPLGPLHVAWCAVNRRTASGRTLGEYERIGVAQALRAITLGAAHTLHLDDEVGSIECGKRADFAVLEDDPLGVAPQALKDVRVWGTVHGGRVFPAASA